MSHWGERVGRGQARVAGRWATWGQSLVLAAGATRDPVEVVRASIGVPVTWTLLVFGTNAGAVAPFELRITPGLGTVSKVAPAIQLASNTFAPNLLVPARELVVSIGAALAPIADITVTVVAAPLHWPSGTRWVSGAPVSDVNND